MALTREFLLAGTGVSALASILLLVGSATPHWISMEGLGYIGLWEGCDENQRGIEICVQYGTDVVGWLNATRAFDVMAMILMFLATAFGIVALCQSGQAMHVKIAALLCALGGISSVVAFGVFAGQYKDIWRHTVNPKFDYSFGLTVTAAILSAIACAVFLRGYRTGYSSL